MEFSLSDEQRRLVDVARRFARDRVRPVAEELDLLEDPVQAFPKTLLEEASGLGLRTLTLPLELGGCDASCLTEVMVLEELCYGDAGFGMTIQHGWREGRMLYEFGTEDQHRRFLQEFIRDSSHVTSLCITEPQFGSDKIQHPRGEDEGRFTEPETVAIRYGDEFIINGRKRWITNGNVSRLLFVVARTDTSVPWSDGCTVFLVPNDAPGFRVGVVEDKVGLRLNQNAELIFEDCRVPVENVLGEVNGAHQVLGKFRNGGMVKEGVKALGCARAALEDAEGYSRERVQGGSLITHHQSVATALAGIAMEIEGARSLAWRAAWATDQGLDNAYALSTMAKVASTRAVVNAGVRAMELQGGRGIRRGTASDRNLRNAVTLMHAPASNDVLLEALHKHLVNRPEPYADPAGDRGSGVQLTGSLI